MPESTSNLKAGKQNTSQLSSEQQELLLETKLFIPPIRLKRVNRPRLMEQLNHGLDKPLILVSAPAGYGKTTLVGSWLRETAVPSAWISLDESDNDPRRFLQYFVTALRRIIPPIGNDLPGMLQGVQPPPLDMIMNLLINRVVEHPAPSLLVLDDFHLIQAQPVLEMVALLLEHMPPRMHLVVLSRTDPPIPLSRLRVRDQLVEIRAEHLRFRPEEVAVFLNEVMELKVAPDDIVALEARTEGWIASVQLAALSMQGTKDLHSFIHAFAGSHRYIMDYLAEEALQLQPERVRAFLLKTSILERLSGPLCEAVARLDQTEGQQILELLEQMNLFVVPLDNEKRWYRYHHLFADVLNRYLEKQFPDQLSDLHRRASRWYAQNGFVPEAIHHALAAGDQESAVRLIEQNGCMHMMRGEAFTLLNWLEAIASHWEDRPWIAVLKAWALALTGHLDRAEPVLRSVESSVEPAARSLRAKILLGSILSARAYLANQHGETGQAMEFARQALDYLPDRVPFARSLRSLTTSILGDASWINGDLETARQAYLEARQVARSADNLHLSVIVSSHIGEILVERGQLSQAARTYEEALQLAGRSPLTARVCAGLGQIAYEWNRLEEAARYAHQCLELSQRWDSAEFEALGAVLLAQVEQAQLHREEAQAARDMTEAVIARHPLSQRSSVGVKSILARLWTAQGDLEKASHLVQECGITLHDEIPYRREPEYLMLLRLLVAQGAYDAAQPLSERLIQPAEAANRTGRVIEILVLQALIFQGRADTEQALTALHRALLLAQRGGYVRLFLDEGQPIAKLLHLAKSRRAETSYAAKLLREMGEMPGGTQLPQQPLIEPLTLRELEVLRLIESGCSNQDIAAKLVISIATVKRHISNVYTKLGAKSRTQAVSVAKELGLF